MTFTKPCEEEFCDDQGYMSYEQFMGMMHFISEVKGRAPEGEEEVR